MEKYNKILNPYGFDLTKIADNVYQLGNYTIQYDGSKFVVVSDKGDIQTRVRHFNNAIEVAVVFNYCLEMNELKNKLQSLDIDK